MVKAHTLHVSVGLIGPVYQKVDVIRAASTRLHGTIAGAHRVISTLAGVLTDRRLSGTITHRAIETRSTVNVFYATLIERHGASRLAFTSRILTDHILTAFAGR